MITDMEKLFQPQRLEGESFENYQLRRITARKYNKLEAKGVLVWDSMAKGTYRKPQE